MTAPRGKTRLDGAARTVLLVSLGALLLAVGVAMVAPGAEDDPVPSTTNTGTQGARAAMLVLTTLSYQARAWDRPLRELQELPKTGTAHTTLILAEPQLRLQNQGGEQAAVHSFLEHGGVVLATGANGAALLGHPEVRPSASMFEGPCLTVPEGRSALARAGSLSMAAPVVWSDEGSARFHVAQRCGQDAVAVQWQVGSGTAVWWSSATPLTNAGLRNDPSLRLLLASIAPKGPNGTADPSPRVVLFDEFLHGAMQGDAPNPLAGLPLPLLEAQAGLLAALLLFSFSRRHAPLRATQVPRQSSPLEFAVSMGALYSRAGATSVPVEAAVRRLHRVLTGVAGLPSGVVAEGSAAIGRALAGRFGEAPAWQALSRDLERAADPAHTGTTRETLALVRALDAHAAALPQRIRQHSEEVQA